METKTKKLISYIILPLLLALCFVQYLHAQAEPDWLMHVNFFDVGQGDSFLITTYEGNQILVDGGPGKGVLEELGRAVPYYDRVIEMVVLTHPHNDHMEGLVEVLEKYEVKKILMPNVEYKSTVYEEFLRAAKDESAEIVYAAQGQRIYLDKATVLDIMYPLSKEVAKPKKSDDVNDASIVAKVTFGRTKILLTGDAGSDIEKKLLPMFDLDADLLKVGHHGSKHSTSEELLAEATPEYSVIQVGNNKYGHPAPEILEKLSKINSKVYRNDHQGSIEFVSDGSVFRPVEN
ncbi:MAG TPA: ComEC/Rec2 family competence protein [Candidatus Binatia bacterium]|nr:ComEC/Rec2 family competence protein [Candidatus Binatia bacterium]